MGRKVIDLVRNSMWSHTDFKRRQGDVPLSPFLTFSHSVNGTPLHGWVVASCASPSPEDPGIAETSSSSSQSKQQERGEEELERKWNSEPSVGSRGCSLHLCVRRSRRVGFVQASPLPISTKFLIATGCCGMKNRFPVGECSWRERGGCFRRIWVSSELLLSFPHACCVSPKLLVALTTTERVRMEIHAFWLVQLFLFVLWGKYKDVAVAVLKTRHFLWKHC